MPGGNRILGWGSHMELESFVKWLGMTPHQAIVTATSAGAELLGRSDLGSVVEGKSADFVVLDANPLDDIRNTREDLPGIPQGRRDRPARDAGPLGGPVRFGGSYAPVAWAGRRASEADGRRP